MPFVRPDVANLLAMMAANPGPQISDLSPADGRAMYQGMGQMLELPRGDIGSTDLTLPGGVKTRLYTPSTMVDGLAVAYYHGGGWVIGDLETHDSLCAEIARALGRRVLAVDYRLAPESPFPAAAEDCIAATRWLAGSPAEAGAAVTGIITAGDSAGGHMAALVTRELHGQLPVPIAAQWLIYPVTDMTASEGSMVEMGEGYVLTKATMDWFIAAYMGGATDKLLHPWASPLHAETLNGLPPALLLTCGLDPLRDQGRAYASRLIEHGVRTIYREAAGQIHGCFTMRQGIPSAQDDLAGCIADLKLLLAGA
jgi:acetyl esterase